MITAGWSTNIIILCVCSLLGFVGAYTGSLINALATFSVSISKNSDDNDTCTGEDLKTQPKSQH